MRPELKKIQERLSAVERRLGMRVKSKVEGGNYTADGPMNGMEW